MQQAWSFLNQYVTYAPLIAFILLLLAGLNLPLSEDLIIISSAFLARSNSELTYYFYIALLLGVIISDHMAYWIGYRVGKGLRKKYVEKLLSPERLEKVHHYIKKFGIFSFIICRFIPFGVRNTLFLSSGIMRMKYGLFILFDSIAAAISVTTLYYLFYHLGSAVERPFKILGIVLFILLLNVVAFGTYRLYLLWKKELRSKQEEK
ncbi:MAG: DedA family protein [Spirochaetales bacterium]